MVIYISNDEMEKCAKESGIPVQREAASRLSYTDGDKIHFSNQQIGIALEEYSKGML